VRAYSKSRCLILWSWSRRSKLRYADPASVDPNHMTARFLELPFIRCAECAPKFQVLRPQYTPGRKSSRQVGSWIFPIVVLSTPNSAYGSMSEVTVDSVRKLEDLNFRFICSLGGDKLGRVEAERTDSLILRGHESHSVHQKRERAGFEAIAL